MPTDASTYKTTFSMIAKFTTQIVCKLFNYRCVEHYQKKTTGASRVEAKLNAAWASPSLAVPSPK